MQTEILLSRITKLLPTCISLCYIDYRESLSGHIDSLQECLSENCWDKLYEELDDYLCESQQAGLASYKSDLKQDLMFKFNVDEDRAYELVYETFGDEIDDFLVQKDSSDAIRDLLKNTRKFSFFIDTGLEIEYGSWRWTGSEQTGWLKKVKRRLNMESNRWDDDIRRMLSGASYGGRLVVFFYGSVEDLITDEAGKDWKSVVFTNPVVAIINTDCGSGDHIYLTGYSFTAAFNRKNLFIDLYFKYNYTKAVCGMINDWCRDSIVKFSFVSTRRRKSAPSPLASNERQDRELTLIYRQGKCTSGDMDIKRHRDVYYINDFPCGSVCPHCGTFWID